MYIFLHYLFIKIKLTEIIVNLFRYCIKHTYIILTPLNPFHIVKLGFTGVYIIFFLFLLKSIDCGYSLEPPRRGGSNEYQQSMFYAEIRKISEFLSENFQVFGGEIFNIFE